MFIQPLDLQVILGNFLAGGSKDILMFIAIAFIAALAGRMRMGNGILLMMVVLLPVIVSVYFVNLYLIAVLFASSFVIFGLVRWLSR